MKTPGAAGGGKRTWAITGVALFAALDIALVGAAYVHGHPKVTGTPAPIATYSSPATPGPAVRPTALSPSPSVSGSK